MGLRHFPPFGNIAVDLALGWDVTSDALFKCCVAIYLALICMLYLVYSAVDSCITPPPPVAWGLDRDATPLLAHSQGCYDVVPL